MKFLNIIVEGSSEEAFVNDVFVKHFSALNVFVSARKIRTGWDKINQKPAKGGLLKYIQFKNDILNWIHSDKSRSNTYYTSFIDLYAFPRDPDSPYTPQIQRMTDPYEKIVALEAAVGRDIDRPSFIPYVQLHEFEALVLVDPDRLLTMYPDSQTGVTRLKKEIQGLHTEEINESPQNALSKRIIRCLPDYEGQKAQVGPLVAGDIGLNLLREKCTHFNDWVSTLENL